MQDIREKLLDDEVHEVLSNMRAATVAATRAHWSNADGRPRRFRRFAVLDDGCEPARLAREALVRFARSVPHAEVYRCGPAAEGSPRPGLPPPPERLARAAALLFADARRAPPDPGRWLGDARSLFRKIAGDRRSFAAVCVLLPEPPPLPGGAECAAEREYAWLLESKPDKTPAERFVLDVERLCREAVRDLGAQVVLLRAPHVFGPGDGGEEGSFVRGIVNAAFAAGRVEIGPSDFSAVRSFASAVDAASASWWALLNATPGNVFNIPSFDASAADIKRILRDEFPEALALKADCPAVLPSEHRCLSGLKFGMLLFKGARPAPEAIRRMAAFATGAKLPSAGNRAIFRGKEPRIRSLEMEILREIDRICGKHGIQYFLAAGTLLGAKRYGHSIPWDDDLDVGFLRSEFRKFRKVAEKELPPHMAYCAWYNDAKAHYTVDKIRIRDTWYSTKYSSNKVMPDGVFVDFLVYDPTSDIPAVARIHNKVAGVFQWFLLQVLWYGLRRRDFRHTSLYLLYRLAAVVPLRVWHWIYERWLTLFWFKRRPKFLLDSLGARAGIKMIPTEGLLDGTVRIPFDDGFMAPSPKDPEGYLRFAYGKDWREEPPLGEQKLHHNPARIDLGAFLSGDLPAGAFRALDLRGELFERDKENA